MIGRLPPRIVNPVPLIAADSTVTAVVPVEVSVTACVVAVSTVTLPKFRLGELTVNCGLAEVVPVPLRETTSVLPLAELLLTVSFPVAAPATVGLNCTSSVVD